MAKKSLEERFNDFNCDVGKFAFHHVDNAIHVARALAAIDKKEPFVVLKPDRDFRANQRGDVIPAAQLESMNLDSLHQLFADQVIVPQSVFDYRTKGDQLNALNEHRIEPAHQRHASAQRNLRDAEQAVQSAEAALATAKDQLEQSKINARMAAESYDQALTEAGY